MTTVCFFTAYSPDTLIAELAMRCRNIYRVPADPTVPALSLLKIYKQPSLDLTRGWAVVLSDSVPFEDYWSPTGTSHPLLLTATCP